MSETYSMNYFWEQIEKMHQVVSQFKTGYKTIGQLMSEPQKTIDIVQVKQEQRVNK